MLPADDMIAALNAFVADPTDSTTLYDLYQVTDGFDSLPAEDKARVVPAMFALMERCPDADLGSPGPMVHSIESLGIDAYEASLIESVRRRPMYLNLGMVNAILNAPISEPKREELLGLLREVCDDPRWAQVAEIATGFLDFQAERRAG